MNKLTISIFLISVILIFASCEESYVPKPRGYIRIDYPEKKYKTYDTVSPYIFDYPTYSHIEKDHNRNTEEYWVNVSYPSLNAKIHMSYKDISGNLAEFEEDTRKLAYKHTQVADAINEKVWVSQENKVYGILYEIKGNAASQVQFYLTDSIKHFVRGALYFSVRPNKDSLAPANAFIRKDIDYMIETFRWSPNFNDKKND